MFIFICILVFIMFFIGSIIFSVMHKPAWSKNYKVENFEEIGTVEKDFKYGKEVGNEFDLYLPNNNTKDNYSLVVYLHAGGFTSGDKAGDKDILEWLASLDYVAAGINYTLASEETEASVLTQSEDIKSAIPIVIDEASKLGYNINQMAIGGGSAGGTLAMLYAYRDSEESPVPVKFLFEAVGPANFVAEDWSSYGLDQSNEAAAALFGVMLGSEIDPNIIGTEQLQEVMKPISPVLWVDEDTVPSVVAYGTHDKIAPYGSALALKQALEANGVDYQFFEAKHSGHGLQNDSDVYRQYMETVEEYLNKYLPV